MGIFMNSKDKELEICNEILNKLEEELNDCHKDYEFLNGQNDDSEEYYDAKI